MNYKTVLDEMVGEVKPSLDKGRVADYIPVLASAPKTRSGIAVQTVDGQSFHAGDAGEPFPIQSLSKVYTMCPAWSYFFLANLSPSGLRFAGGDVQCHPGLGKPEYIHPWNFQSRQVKTRFPLASRIQ